MNHNTYSSQAPHAGRSLTSDKAEKSGGIVSTLQKVIPRVT